MQVLKSMLLWLRRDRAAVSIAKTHKISNENIVDLQTVCTHLYIFNNNFVVVVVRLGLFSFRTTVFTKMKRPQATQKIKKIKHSLLTVVLEAVDKLKMVHAWLLKTFHSTVQCTCVDGTRHSICRHKLYWTLQRVPRTADR